DRVLRDRRGRAGGVRAGPRRRGPRRLGVLGRLRQFLLRHLRAALDPGVLGALGELALAEALELVAVAVRRLGSHLLDARALAHAIERALERGHQVGRLLRLALGLPRLHRADLALLA